ncbi:LOW QUALITY PROTEIN: piriformospora indica-insensitive protein 2-like [Primulina tabacum]|uniref:LOW QUALITY PROTEIN: piriformospora indica-insensitive protein 2-like n=1 Tax=Primulina tabacum TaxID=48773 RepID=UPI003F59E673
MKKIKSLSSYIVILCILRFLCVWCNGEDETVTAPMKRTEQEVLYSAIQDFVGKWWNGSDLYPDPCGWTPIQGVSCDIFDGFWYVTDLSIGPVYENSLICDQTVGFSPHLFALRHLKSLSFFSCFVSPHPVSIPAQHWEVFAESLVSLEFRSNPGLTGQIPATFAELRNLESLVLMENGLTGEIPINIGNLTKLKRLNLAGNRFKGEVPDNFGGLNHLLILDFSSNSFSGSLPSTFGGLTSLLKLDLSNNQFEGKIPENIKNLKNLTLLDLSSNKFSNGLTKSLQELTSMEEIFLSNNPIGGSLADVEWHDMVRLTALDLSNTILTGGIPESFSELKGLRFLGLSDNMLAGDVPPKLANLPNLSAIYIHGNNLTGDLKFPKGFYEKLGRRFAAWGNPNLCYPIGSIPTNYVPFGVKICKQDQEVKRYETCLHTKSKICDGIRNPDSISMASMASMVNYVGRLVWFIEIMGALILNI